MTIVIGGQYYRWNESFSSGFWTSFTSLVINALGYICLTFCMSEMSSTLPFSGGIYGFVRAFVGPYVGYIASRFEIVLNICYVSSAVLAVGSFPTYAGISSREVEPGWWCLMYGFAMVMSLVGCSPYWTLNKMLGGVALVLMVVYLLGSLGSLDFRSNADGDVEYTGTELMEHFQSTSCLFLGIQYLPLASVKCADVSESQLCTLFANC